MGLNYILFYLYCIGIVIAFIIGCYDAYCENKRGNDISEAHAVIPVLSLMSWLYIIMYIYNRFFRKNKSL